MPLSTELKTMAISEILEKHPQTRPIFQEYGLQAYARTETAKYENLEATALTHSIDLKILLDALVNAIEKH